MNAYDAIKEASEWAPHRRDEALAEKLIKRAVDEGWKAEHLVSVLPKGIQKEAIIGLLQRAGRGIDKATWSLLKGTAKGTAGAAKAVGGAAAKPTGAVLSAWGKKIRDKPLGWGIGTAYVGSQGLRAGGEFARSLGPKVKRMPRRMY